MQGLTEWHKGAIVIGRAHGHAVKEFRHCLFCDYTIAFNQRLHDGYAVNTTIFEDDDNKDLNAYAAGVTNIRTTYHTSTGLKVT
ncbi:hypothetical protein AVEN_191146-1 [Araneus ventricosus]|uniref:Uncharacterized protein n=1 Tax=Araneus ventricosus TaxID=182803 RepID=A0A4Y2AY53_ARAVE|nr:hypothetical protein AVEN_191146-1 [Araneus ventricosus]